MKTVLLALIRFYRRVLSPRKGKPACRYFPTCSQYAATAIERYGAWKGGWMAAWRLLRCNPFSVGGVDYVPYTPDENGGYRPANALAVSIARNTAETTDKETKRTGAST